MAVKPYSYCVTDTGDSYDDSVYTINYGTNCITLGGRTKMLIVSMFPELEGASSSEMLNKLSLERLYVKIEEGQSHNDYIRNKIHVTIESYEGSS